MPTLEWIGKDKVINHHLDVPYRVLNKKYTYNADDSENKIIRGDNLEALKALLPQYEGKIKCIYIDPPYNTGNEKWIYNDNVNDPKMKKWLGDVVGKEGEDLTRHDKWLCMMYPRLKLLQKLLADDGAIFISIDFHEQSNLKLLCDEIFGVSNYIAEVACVNSPKGRDKSKNADMATAHECITIYRKSSNFKMGGFEPDDKITVRYNKIDALSDKRYRLIDLRKTGNSDERVDRPNLFYPFFFNEKTNDFFVGENNDITPEGYVRIEPIKNSATQGRWCWEADTARNKIDLLLPQFQKVKNQWSVFQIDYLDERELVTPTTAWTFKDVNSERGTEMFQKKLGFAKNDFPNPKPVGTIERIIQIGMKPNSIILDSFAGSGTTAHAVLNMNKSDGGNRKFILVEMEDYAETITAERVRRVIDGYGNTDGTGGNFNFYELGEPLLLENKFLNENIPVQKIREYIYFMETKCPLANENSDDNKYFLDVHNSTAYYFYYEKEMSTTLDRKFLNTIKSKTDSYVIYADINTLSSDELLKYGITFKKIPRDIARL